MWSNSSSAVERAARLLAHLPGDARLWVLALLLVCVPGAINLSLTLLLLLCGMALLLPPNGLGRRYRIRRVPPPEGR